MECAHLARFLTMNDFELKGNPEGADLLILYACGLTQLDAQVSIDVLEQLQNKRRARSEFLVWGCLPKIDPELVAKTHKGPSFGRREIHKLEELVGSKVKYDEITVNSLFPESENLRRIRSNYEPDRFTYLLEEINHQIRQETASIVAPDIFYIMVARGCLGNCSYCSDLRSCGRLESKSIEKVASELKQGLAQGFRRFLLVTTDLGVYGKDYGYDLSHLLRELTRNQEDYELLLPNVNPQSLNEMFEDLKGVLKLGKIGLLGVPVQSGSDRILDAMGRKYSVEDFEECISAIKRDFPKVVVWTQLMVGFPGETEEDFGATMKLLDEIGLDYVQVFRFSRRPTTPASYFTNQVPEPVSLNRYQKLLAKAIYKALCEKIGDHSLRAVNAR